mmetsp:Transcript_46349/g.132151  ORF Transcript_46349/g.132151 Transcript_46349/m.132151 type:complete len:221 (-) Transcript_46349:600-1262(-)
MASSAAQRITAAVRTSPSLKSRRPCTDSASWPVPRCLDAWSIRASVASSDSLILSRCCAMRRHDSPAPAAISARSCSPAPATALSAHSPYPPRAASAQRATRPDRSLTSRRSPALLCRCATPCLVKCCNSHSTALFRCRASDARARSWKLRCAEAATLSAASFAISPFSAASIASAPACPAFARLSEHMRSPCRPTSAFAIPLVPSLVLRRCTSTDVYAC